MSQFLSGHYETGVIKASAKEGLGRGSKRREKLRGGLDQDADAGANVSRDTATGMVTW